MTRLRAGRLRVAVAAVAVLLLLALVLVPVVKFASRDNPRRSGTNGVFPSEIVASLAPGQGLCQVARVPGTTGAIEIPLRDAAPGQGLRLAVRAPDGTTIARATSSGLRAGAARFVLSRPVRRDVVGQVCLRQGPTGGNGVLGSLAQNGMTLDARPAAGAITMTYYRPGSESLIAMAPVIAQRIGLTRGHFGGAWRGVAVVLLFAAAVALATWLFVAVARGRALGRLAVLCATVAVLNSLAWALLTPTLQVPDEPFHLSYIQDLAEHGEPPMVDGRPDRPSDELILIGNGSQNAYINFNPTGRPNWSPQKDRELDAQLAAHPSEDNPGAVASLRDYPPLYYAAMIPFYGATHLVGGTTLDAITVIRIVGSLLAGVTIFLIFCFLRELFPERRGLVAGVTLICAFQPVLTWIHGGVNPDAVLIPLGATIFYLLARAWRRGLTVGVAVGLGLAVAASVLVKLSALGYLPALVIALAVLGWRGRRGPWLRPVVAGGLAAAVPLVLYGLVNTLVWGRTLLPSGVTDAANGPPPTGPGRVVSGFPTYLWEYLLPRVGSMTDFFGARWLPRDFWTPLWVGKFGWFDYQFPDRVNHAAFVLFAAIAVAAFVALVLRWRRDWGLILLFVVFSGGLFGAIARAGYQLRAQGNQIFEQARYLMPLLAMYAFAIALAVSLLRRRAELAVLGLLGGLAAVHLLGAFILTVRRYYL